MRCIYTIECDLAIKKSKILICATTRTNPENIKLNKPDIKGRNLCFPLCEMSKTDKSAETGSRLEAAGEVESRVRSDCLMGRRFLLGGDGDALELDGELFVRCIISQ